MKSIFKISTAVFSLMIASSALFAQTPAEQKPVTEEIKTTVHSEPVEIKGRVFLQYGQVINPKDSKESYKVSVERAYVDINKKFSDNWSVRITSDINGSTGSPYSLMAKYAYLQGKYSFGPVSMKGQFGLVGTPVIGMVDDISAYRWIDKNSLDNASAIMGSSIDSSADLGAKLDINIMKIATISGMICNGDGYKTINKTLEMKTYYAALDINPEKYVKPLHVIGFYKRNAADSAGSKNYDQYLGGGAAFSNDLIKVGAYYTMAKVVANDTTTKNMWMVEGFANANLESVIKYPVLLMGKYAMGKDKKVTDSDVTQWGVGAGYQLHKNIQCAVYVDNYQYKLDTKKPARTLYVKSDIKF